MYEKYNLAKIFQRQDSKFFSDPTTLLVENKFKMLKLISANKHKLNSPKTHKACKN